MVKAVVDPLLTYCSVTYQKQETSFGWGVIFAANERWALGAHLQYAKNSLLTYQLYYSRQERKPTELSYAHSLDGSLQRLGLKIPF